MDGVLVELMRYGTVPQFCPQQSKTDVLSGTSGRLSSESLSTWPPKTMPWLLLVSMCLGSSTPPSESGQSVGTELAHAGVSVTATGMLELILSWLEAVAAARGQDDSSLRVAATGLLAES
jgi:hypothetical protein